MKESSVDAQKIIRRRHDGELEYSPDEVTIEQPLEIRIGRKTLAITMRTPGHDDEIAAGFLLSEAIVRDRDQIVSISAASDNRVIVGLASELKIAREDIGRHNAVDKVIGRALLDGLVPLHSHFLLVSGRASFEIVQKALAAGIPIVAAVSAPSSLAVEFARDSNQTLIGFLR